jgi:hypothetical protein
VISKEGGSDQIRNLGLLPGDLGEHKHRTSNAALDDDQNSSQYPDSNSLVTYASEQSDGAPKSSS